MRVPDKDACTSVPMDELKGAWCETRSPHPPSPRPKMFDVVTMSYVIPGD